MAPRFIAAAHADGDDGRAAHGEHGRQRYDERDKRHGDIDRPQCCRSDALSDKNTVYHIVEVGYKQSAQRRQNVANEGSCFAL